VPVLTYGTQVWFTDVKQTLLLCTLQVAQNEACRKLAGVFHTTPAILTQSLIAIPPIRYTLRHLLRAAATCLSWLPLSCAIHNPSTHSTLVPHFQVPLHMIPTPPPIAGTPARTDEYTLECPLPTYIIPPHPAQKPWSCPGFVIYPKTKNHLHAKNALRHTSTDNLKIFIQHTPSHIPHLHFTSFGIFLHDSVWISDYCYGPSKRASLMLALVTALCCSPPSTHISFFYKDAAFPSYCTSPTPSPLLPFALALQHAVEDYITNHPLTTGTLGPGPGLVDLTGQPCSALPSRCASWTHPRPLPPHPKILSTWSGKQTCCYSQLRTLVPSMPSSLSPHPPPSMTSSKGS
jgi:hypothetical protein